MSEETTTEETGEKSPEQSFAELRAQRDALESELRPLKVEKIVRDAGFDPKSGNGLALQDLLGFDADVETAKEVAAKYGWEPAEPKPQDERTKEQRVVEDQSQRFAQLQSATSSDSPPDRDQAIAEAEAKGDWNTAVNLKLQSIIEG